MTGPIFEEGATRLRGTFIRVCRNLILKAPSLRPPCSSLGSPVAEVEINVLCRAYNPSQDGVNFRKVEGRRWQAP